MISFLFLAFKILALPFGSLIIICLSVGLSEFTLLGIVFPEWLYSCVCMNLGSLQSLFLQIFSLPLSLSFPSETLIMCTVVCSMVAYTSLRLCSLFSKLFPFCSSNSITSIVLTSSLLILLFSNLPLNPLVNFSTSIIALFISRISF